MPVVEPRSGGPGSGGADPGQGRGAVLVEPDLATALEQARVAAAGEGGVVCVTGSLNLVGQARAALGLAVPEYLW